MHFYLHREEIQFSSRGNFNGIEGRKNAYRQLLKIPRFGIIEEYSLNLLRALRFLPKSFYFFFNRVARYTQSKESRNLSSKIP